MADTKLSGLAALAGTSAAAGDLWYIDDVSAGAAGSKSIRSDNLLAALAAVTPALRTSGVTPYFQVAAPADTTLTASTEAVGVYFVGATRQHATGALAAQREFVIDPPTYSFVAASTLTEAVTFAVTGPPVTGTNATITRAYTALFTGLVSVRQAGGVAGVDQLDLYDDGTRSYVESKNSLLRFVAGGGAAVGIFQFLDNTGSIRATINNVAGTYTDALGTSVGGGGTGTAINAAGLDLINTGTVTWRASSGGAVDTSLSRVAAGVMGGVTTWVQNAPAVSRVSTQFDKTNTSLANVTGLSSPLKAGRTYKFVASLPVTADAVGGYKVAVSGTCTATAIYYDVTVVTTGVAPSLSRQTALDGATGGILGTTVRIWIEGTITVNAAGTLTIQFAQNAANGTSSVLVGAEMVLDDIP